MSSTKRNLKEVLKAIEGSGGVVKIVADRLGVDRDTVYNYMERWATAKAAMQAEDESTADMAESLIRRNIMIALKKQADATDMVETGDARWWLKTRRRDRFSERQEITGADGERLTVDLTWRTFNESDDGGT